MKEIQVIKKDNSVEPFMKEKLFNAVGKSAERVLVNLTDELRSSSLYFLT